MMKKPYLPKLSLSKEIIVTLVIKVILIVIIWWAFFSEPLDEHLKPADVGSALFGSSPMPDNSAALGHSPRSKNTKPEI